jgi:hypothetical protein
VTALADACAELAAWLPAAEALITQPDADGSTGRGQPSSRPPWNGAAADALLDAAEGARQLEAAWRSGRRRPIAATGAVLASIVRLSYGETEGEQRQAIIAVTRWTTAILQLPAVDEAERPQRVEGPCPYCGFGMLRVYPRSGRVACLRGAGACRDGDGQPPQGHARHSRLDGTPQIEWSDGLVT